MNKLRLDIDEIEVSGFDSMPADALSPSAVNGGELISKITWCNQLTCLC